MGTIKLGFSQKDITPSETIQTIGFGRPDEWSKGVLHPLAAQITLWSTDTEKCCLVAIDHIGFSKEHVNFLRDEIGKLISISRDQVMLCFSHTHSSPNDSLSLAYFNFVCSEIKSGVLEASRNMNPVHGVWGNAYTHIGLNRRSDSDALDKRVGILKICNAKTHKLELILLRLTAHNNVLKGDNYLISPDYFGAVRDTLEAQYHCPIVLTQGASGNVAPKYFDSILTPPDACDNRFIRSKTALEDMAQMVLHDVKPIIDALKPTEIHTLCMYSRQLLLFSEVPSYERALEVAHDAKVYCSIDGTNWLAEVQHLIAQGITTQEENIEVQYFRLDEGCLCGVPNEIMCEFALRASEILHNEHFYFGGYTNGCTGYFPSEEEFDKGGYEVYWSLLIYYIYHGHVFPLQRDSATKLIEFAAKEYQNY